MSVCVRACARVCVCVCVQMMMHIVTLFFFFFSPSLLNTTNDNNNNKKCVLCRGEYSRVHDALSNKYKIMYGTWNHSDSSVTGFRFQYCKSGLPMV